MPEKNKQIRPLLIRGGRIIDPSQGIDETGNLLIGDGKVLWRGKGEATPPATEYDILPAQGLVVCPGFIDLHCHLRQPGFEAKETIATGTLAAARGGFTTVCCMPNTNPPLDSAKAIEYIKKEAARSGAVRVLPIGCVSRGRAGKELSPMAEMAEAGAIGFSDDGSPVLDFGLMLSALKQSRELGLPVIDHCEHTGLTEGGVMNQGAISERLGVKGMPAAAEDVMVARDVALAGMTGGWVHIAHVSTEESVKIIRQAKQAGIRVTAEATPHHLTLNEDIVDDAGRLDTNSKVNPPLRTERDRLSLLMGLKLGVIDIIATDHAPHTASEKELGPVQAPSGISGLETALGSLMWEADGEWLTLNNLISRLTSEPARIIGGRWGRLGTLATGAEGDVTIFDPGRKWIVDTREFASKGKNTPWAGSELKGKVMATLFGGKLVWCDESIKVEKAKEE